MAFSIRTVSVHDAEAIVALLNPIILAGKYTAMSAPQSVDDQRAFIRSLPDRGVYLAAIDDEADAVLGVQDILPSAEEANRPMGEISTFIALGQHRRGIGKALTARTLAAAKDVGYRTIRATIRRDNLQAQMFYVAQGFVIETETVSVTESVIATVHLA